MPTSNEILAVLKQAGVPAISQTLYGLGIMNAFIPGLNPANRDASCFAGPAFTLRAITAREDLRDDIATGRVPNPHRAAMAQVGAGDVIVTGIGDLPGVSMFGDLISTHLRNVGCAGIVTDGGVADLAALGDVNLPVFCAGSAPVPASARVLIVGTNEPIECRGVPVYPGDIVVGDINGAVVVPAHLAESVANKAIAKEKLEEFLLMRLEAGEPLNGTYPPNKETLAAYEAHAKAQGVK